MQLPLNIKSPRLARPLISLETARATRDCTEAELLDLIDCGALWAIDIKTADADRRELRILTASLGALPADVDLNAIIHRTPATFTDALALILHKHQKPFLRGAEITRALNCGRKHLINLIDDASLPQAPRTNYRRGPGGSPVVLRTDFIHFLTTRVIGGL